MKHLFYLIVLFYSALATAQVGAGGTRHRGNILAPDLGGLLFVIGNYIVDGLLDLRLGHIEVDPTGKQDNCENNANQDQPGRAGAARPRGVENWVWLLLGLAAMTEGALRLRRRPVVQANAVG